MNDRRTYEKSFVRLIRYRCAHTRRPKRIMTRKLKAIGLIQILSDCTQFSTHNGRYMYQNLALWLGYWNVGNKK